MRAHNNWYKYIFLYGCISLLTPECLVCVFVCPWYQIRVPAKSHMCKTSVKDTLLRKTHVKVLRLDMCRSMMSVTKIAYQLWNDHPFSQRNKTTEGAAWVGAGDVKIWKWGGGGVGNIGGRLHMKLGEGWLGPLWQLCFHYFIF